MTAVEHVARPAFRNRRRNVILPRRMYRNLRMAGPDNGRPIGSPGGNIAISWGLAVVGGGHEAGMAYKVSGDASRLPRSTPRANRVRVDPTAASSGPGWRGYLRALGPGLVTGASDDDPSGIATYSQAGAQFRYSLLWTSLLTLPLMAAIQEICDRTALATGTSLGELSVRKFPRLRAVLWVLVSALIVANVLNITADVVAVGEGMHLLHAGSSTFWALVAGVLITVLIIAGSFETIARVFKLVCLALLTYVIVLFASHAVLVPGRGPHADPACRVHQGLHAVAGRRTRDHDLALPVLLANRAPGRRTPRRTRRRR